MVNLGAEVREAVSVFATVGVLVSAGGTVAVAVGQVTSFRPMVNSAPDIAPICSVPLN